MLWQERLGLWSFVKGCWCMSGARVDKKATEGIAVEGCKKKGC